jgi:hypothetical protein
MVRVVDVSSRHTHQAQKVHREEGEVHAEEHKVEVGNEPATVYADPCDQGESVSYTGE